MNINAFLSYLSINGMGTGISSLIGAYSMSSGVSGIVPNLLYSNSSQFINGNINASLNPLISLSSGYATNKVLNNNLYHIGFQETGNFGLVFDLQYSGCIKRSQNLGQDYVLLSTVPNPSGFSSGFAITINDANRLSFITSGYSYTLQKELTPRDFVSVGLMNNRYINLGIYNVYDNKIYRADIIVPNASLNTPDIYIGNFLNNQDTGNYAPLISTIYSMAFFNSSISNSNIITCANALITTGFITGQNIITVSGTTITGFQFSGINILTYTGTSQSTGVLTNSSGSGLNIIFTNQLSGFVTTGNITVPYFGYTGININRPITNFLFDQSILNTFSTYNVEMNLIPSSGDVIEIYTYNLPNSNINLSVTGFFVPKTTGFMQLYGNGLNETSGVDYQIIRSQFSGYDGQDILSYDILPSPTIIVPYSGYWSGSAILLSGGVYFPPNPQYDEPTGSLAGQVRITGISGVCVYNNNYPVFGYGISLNGQLLVSGLQYGISNSGVSGFVISLSGSSLPFFDATSLYSPTGGLPTGINNVQSSELAFLPQYTGFNYYLFELTQNQNIMNNITGFSAMVYFNGIRQFEGNDFVRDINCQFVSGFIHLPQETNNQIYNSESDLIDLWNRF